ncbi:MAG: hypothetical protein J4G10_06955 [Alphaproteobacteria bacterium]|nr:hypothetical protein [Alphaproteobacteria bacterium]
MNPGRRKNGDAGANESPQVRRLLRLPAWCLAAFLLLLLAACESGSDLPNPEPAFARVGLAGDWIAAGGPEIVFMDKAGIPALKVAAASGHSFVGRRLDASLIAGPYLRWAWYLETTFHASGHHLSDATAPPRNPLRLRIAFRGGPREPESVPASPWTASGVPAHDRLLDLIWDWQAASLTQGGDWRPVEVAAPGAGALRPSCSVPCVPIQKRLEDTDQWWLEAADLEKIYRQFWPEDHLKEVRVVFVALVLEPSPVPITGYLADLDFRR